MIVEAKTDDPDLDAADRKAAADRAVFEARAALEPDPEETVEAEVDDSRDGWAANIGNLLASRIGIFSIESKVAAKVFARKAFLAVLLLLSVVFGYIFCLLGLTGILTQVTNFEWYHIALMIGGGHLLIALIAILLLSRSIPKLFEHTTEEFQNDRLWLQRLKSSEK